jgi:quercetin dioxygenase-like cupin family protein
LSCTPCAVNPVQGHYFAGGVYAKEALVPAGYEVSKHTHAYSHLSILASGQARVTAGEKSTVYTKPACIEIKAGIPHLIEAITDVVWFCIHATDETDIEKVDEVLITKGV